MMSDGLFNTEVISRLPPSLQAMLKRKSSRDPSSRFTAKLRALIDFTAMCPHFESDVGVAWIDDEAFKINKRALAGIMGIKINTLNVNLRDLGFSQEQSTKDGWTRWKKAGFTRHSAGAPEEASATPPFPEMAPAPVTRIGKVSPDYQACFVDDARQLWRELCDGAAMPSLAVEYFLKKAGEKFRTEQQAMQNAVDVLRAIICPTNEAVVNEAQFVRFMAAFGPVSTVMIKIASLLEVAHSTGQWLTFDPMPAPQSISAAFDRVEANCLVVRRGQVCTRVWNLPLVDAGRTYVVDELGKMYASWAEYFAHHPVSPGTTSFFDSLY
jgi:hypothetical protein